MDSVDEEAGETWRWVSGGGGGGIHPAAGARHRIFISLGGETERVRRIGTSNVYGSRIVLGLYSNCLHYKFFTHAAT